MKKKKNVIIIIIIYNQKKLVLDYVNMTKFIESLKSDYVLIKILQKSLPLLLTKIHNKKIVHKYQIYLRN